MIFGYIYSITKYRTYQTITNEPIAASFEAASNIKQVYT